MDTKLFWKIEGIIFLVVFVLTEVIGLCFGSVIEGNLFAEIAKWLLVGACFAALVCGTVWALVATLVNRKKDKK